MLNRHGISGPGEVDAGIEYEAARLPRELTTAVTWYMSEHGVTKRELAQRMRVTPGRVSQILSGDENLTLRTLAAVCTALDARLRVELVPSKPAGPAHGTFARGWPNRDETR
jgi:transcriptional regulator with XRE-family HTH domain